MKTTLAIIIGYLIGSISPSAMIAKIKKVDLRHTGTKNLGASNTLLSIGKLLGVLVMLLDIAKGAAAVLIGGAIAPESNVIPLIAGVASVFGHVFPFYLGFRGGKGLASFGGMILAYDPAVFLFLLILGVTLMIVVNYSFALPMSAAILFPFLALFRTKSISVFAVSVVASALVIVKHSGNVVKAMKKEDLIIRDFIKNDLFKKKK